MKKIVWVTLVAVSVFIVSCKKDNDDTIPDPVTPPAAETDYMPLKTGNYWVYQRYEVDSSGNATALNVFDSCYVEKDTVINGATYAKLTRPDYLITGGTIYLRDSSDYVISWNGKLVFSDVDTATYFYSHYYIDISSDTICFIQTKMTEMNTQSTVPAGTFVTCNAKTTYNMYPPYDAQGAVRTRHFRLGADVGIITETLEFFTSNPKYIERRLVRYHLN